MQRFARDATTPADGVGVRLKRARAGKKLSREKLAAQAGVSASMIRRIETTGHVPRGDRLRDIARVLDVSVDYLLGDAAA